MYKLSLGLGKSVFQPECLLAFGEYGDVFSKIKQHRIILSGRIIEYYMSSVSEFLTEIIQNYISDISTNNEQSHSFIDNDVEDIREFIVSCVSQVPVGALVSEIAEFKDVSLGNKVQLITPAEIHSNSENLVSLYSIPIVNYTAQKNEPCNKYKTWLRRWFNGERKIEIIDEFIYCRRGISSLNKYYFPSMQDGTEVHLYSCLTEKSEYTTEQEIRDKIYSEHNARLSISIHFIEKYHERYIILPSCQITIGKGLDFLCPNGFVGDECNISISAEKKYNPPQICGIESLLGKK